LAGEHHIPHKNRGQAKVALVHDFLLQMGGAEKVLEVLHSMFPAAPVYTSAYDPQAMPAHYRTWDIRTSFLQRMPLKSRLHRAALPLYPMAFESFDLSEYDLVLSSSSAFARGIITQPDTTHICYTHTPMRYAWSTQTYMENERVGKLSRALATPVLHYLRLWDAAAAQRPDHYVANSSVVAARIRKFYRRESVIIPPPVDTTRFTPSDATDDYYIIVSRFVPYKRLDLAVDAFTRLGRPLKIVGMGRQRAALEARAGKNIEFLGHVSDADLPGLVARARGFIMPGEEDFGIAPVEAMACGVPVIAYAAGGALDTQCDGKTGVLFCDPTVQGLCQAIHRFETLRFDPLAIRAHSRCFDQQAYVRNMTDLIARVTNDRPSPTLAAVRLQEQVV
jgi:glycosyltransferase involved in cell wall biosynthesis